jgi:hypothetical protein
MCHAIEDPTFDATAVATNPRARRPVHRPRMPADRVPHCRWEVFIDPAADPVREIPLTGRVRTSRLANLPIEPITATRAANDYAGPFVPDFHLATCRTTPSQLRELSIQNHLLARS